MSRTVQFTDASTPGPSGSIISRSWDFGDGSPLSSETNPAHDYADGTYTVRLTVTGGGTDGTATVTHSVVVTTPATPSTMPKVASVQQRTGETWAQAVERVMTYGFNGAVRYLPSGTKPSWDAQLQALAAAKGSEAINLQLTAKTHDDAGLTAVLTNLPDAWRAGFIYNIFQEPEDNWHAGQFTAATYKGWYADAAATITAYNAANPTKAVSGPWVEWQEWSLDPSNGQWDLSQLVPAAGDFDGVLWSFFEYHERDRIAAMVTEITNFMSAHTAGKPWGFMASCYTLHPYQGPFTDAQLHAQANWLQNSYDAAKSAGLSEWAWYNVQFQTGTAAGEGRIELNPYALAILPGLS